MFKSIFGIVKDVAEVVIAPVEIAADITRAVTKPMAEVAKEMVEDVKEAVNPGDEK